MTGADRIKLARLAVIQTAICAIDGQIKDLDKQVPALLTDLGCTLTEMHGIGAVTAMTLITEVGDPHRFATESQFARWCGAAPVALSSGEGDGPAHRHRPVSAGLQPVPAAGRPGLLSDPVQDRLALMLSG